MNTLKPVIAALFVLSFCLAGTSAEQQENRLVSLLIHVEGKHKNLSLTNSDVAVFERGQKVDAASVSISPAYGRDATIAILVDESGSNQDKVAFMEQSVVDVFDAAEASGANNALLFTFADTVHGGGLGTRRDVQRWTIRPVRGAGSALYAAITNVAKALGDSGGASRRLLFVVTDGDDTSVGVSSQDAIDACVRAGVTIIPIGLLSHDKERIGKSNLLSLSKGTGGRAVILDGPANVKALVSEILRSEYILSFPEQTGSGFHPVSVDLSSAAKGVSLRVPSGYYVR